MAVEILALVALMAASASGYRHSITALSFEQEADKVSVGDVEKHTKDTTGVSFFIKNFFSLGQGNHSDFGSIYSQENRQNFAESYHGIQGLLYRKLGVDVFAPESQSTEERCKHLYGDDFSQDMISECLERLGILHSENPGGTLEDNTAMQGKVPHVYQGDMIIRDDEELVTLGIGPRRGATIRLNSSFLQTRGRGFDPWPQGKVFYKFGDRNQCAPQIHTMFRQACAEWQRTTCIVFYECSRGKCKNIMDASDVIMRRSRTYDEPIVLITTNQNGCFSYVGYRPNEENQINLQTPGCDMHGIIVHEIGHTLGKSHEQSRMDRDSYLSFNPNLVSQEVIHNFRKEPLAHDRMPYDYGSIMHYGRYDFSLEGRHGRPVLNAPVPIGQRNGVSDLDVQKMRDIYRSQCRSAPTCNPKTSCDPGWQCGSQEDGCGGEISCGICSSGQCQSGEPSICACEPKSKYYACFDDECGQHPDGCGGTIVCGKCGRQQKCEEDEDTWRHCVSTCKPHTLCLGECGEERDGCRGWLSCNSTCRKSDLCIKNRCIEQPKHCLYGQWSSWGPCDAQCGRQGWKTRQRGVIRNGAHGGTPCSEDETDDAERCSGAPCPTNCKWSVWSAWSVCSATCHEVGSHRPRQRAARKVERRAQHGGSSCKGSSVKSQDCNARTCPLPVPPEPPTPKYKEGDWVELKSGGLGLLTTGGEWNDAPGMGMLYYLKKGCVPHGQDSIEDGANALILMVMEKQNKRPDISKVERVNEADVRKKISAPAQGVKEPCIHNCVWRTVIDPVDIERKNGDHKRCNGVESDRSNILVKDFGRLEAVPRDRSGNLDLHRWDQHMQACREAVNKEPLCGNHLWYSYTLRKCMCKAKHEPCILEDSSHPQRIEYYYCNDQQCAPDTKSFDPDRNGNCGCGNVKEGDVVKESLCYRPNGPSGKILAEGCPKSIGWSRQENQGNSIFSVDCPDCVCCIVDDMNNAPGTFSAEDCRKREWDDMIRPSVLLKT